MTTAWAFFVEGWVYYLQRIFMLLRLGRIGKILYIQLADFQELNVNELPGVAFQKSFVIDQPYLDQNKSAH